MQYQKAGIEEIDILIKLRKAQLIDEGQSKKQNIDGELHVFFASSMGSESLVEWIAEEEGEAIASAAVLFVSFPPSFNFPTNLKGYVTNMYTLPAFRGRGIATALLGKLVEEARSRGANHLWLGASEMGRPVYEKFGFQAADELMQMDL